VNGGLANGYLERDNLGATAGLRFPLLNLQGFHILDKGRVRGFTAARSGSR